MEDYRVGVSLVLANGVSPALAIIGKEFLGLGKHVKDVEAGIAGWSTKLKGVAGLLGAAGILGTMVSLIDKTKDFNSELIRLQRVGGGMSSAVTSGALTKQAFALAQRIPMRVEDLMKIPGMTYSIFRGDMSEVRQTWAPLARLGYVLRSDGESRSDVTKQVAAALRAGELTGRITDASGNIDVSKLNSWLDFVARVTTATHGMVNGESLLSMAKQGGFTMRNLSPGGMAQLAELNQAMGGPRAGTAYMSLWQQFAGGVMYARNAQALQDLGLLHKGEWSTKGGGGRVILSDAASRRLTALISNDPMKFAEAIKAAMVKHGITNPTDQLRELVRLVSRQTSERMAGEMFTNMNQQLAERGIIMQGYGAGQSFNLVMNKGLQANLDAVASAWHNLILAVAGPQAQNEISVLKNLTGFFNSMNAVAIAHPEAVKLIGEGIAALAVGVAGVSVAALATFATLPAAITGAVVALGAMAALNWRGIITMFDAIKTAIESFLHDIVGIYDKIKGVFSSGKPSGKGAPSFSLPASPMRFVPGSPGSPKLQPISLSLNVDGRTLAQAVSDQLERLYGYPTDAPAFDSSSRWQAGDSSSEDI